MTFKIQEYNQLKEKYQKTKKTYLEYHGNKESIEGLDPARKEAMKFIECIIAELDKSIAEMSKQSEAYSGKKKPRKLPSPSPTPAELLTVTTHLISTFITANLGKFAFDSKLRNLLNADLEMDDHTPNDVTFYRLYRKLNGFLRIYFTNQDSREGIALDNPFRFIDKKSLISFIKTALDQEELYFNKVVGALETASKEINAPSLQEEIPVIAVGVADNEARIKSYRVREPAIAKNMPGLSSFSALDDSITTLEQEERDAKGITKIEELQNNNRKTQLLVLNKLRESLSDAHIKEQDKIAILAGTMYIVREQISSESIFYHPLSNTDNNSLIHTGLTKRLNAKDYSSEDIHDLVKAALSYITYLTLNNMEQIRARHIFSDIPSFSLKDTLKLGQKMLTVCRIKSLDAASAAYDAALEKQNAKDKADAALAEQKAKAQEPSSSFASLLEYVGGFFSSISTPAPVNASNKDEVAIAPSQGPAV